MIQSWAKNGPKKATQFRVRNRIYEVGVAGCCIHFSIVLPAFVLESRSSVREQLRVNFYVADRVRFETIGGPGVAFQSPR
jgi:hypothetical protein